MTDKEMMNLASQVGANDDLIRHKFQQALPEHIAPILMTQKTATLEELGKLADELMALKGLGEKVSMVSPNASSSSHSRDKHSFRRHKQNGIAPFSEGQRPKVCRWHLYFGHQSAKRCMNWCQWPTKQKCSILLSNNSSPASSRSSSPTPSVS